MTQLEISDSLQALKIDNFLASSCLMLSAHIPIQNTVYVHIDTNTNLCTNTETISSLLQFYCDKFYTQCLGWFLDHCYQLSLYVPQLNLPNSKFSFRTLFKTIKIFQSLLNLELFHYSKNRFENIQTTSTLSLRNKSFII